MGEPLRILLMEDEPAHRELFTHHMGRTAFANSELVVAGSIAEGRSILEAGQFDLLFFDLSLPDSSVTQSMESITGLARHCPVIVLTSLDDQETLMNVIKNGADDCLPKIELSDRMLERTIRYTLDRWRMGQQLRESEQRFHALIENMHEGIMVFDARDTITQCNPHALELLGVDEARVLGKATVDLQWHLVDEQGRRLQPDDYPSGRAIATGKPLRNQTIGIERPAVQGMVWVLLDAEPQFDESGKLESVIVSFTDFTPLRQAQQALAENEARYRSLVENAADAFFQLDMNGVVRNVNRLACESLGYTRAELVGMHVSDFETGIGREEIASLIASHNPGDIFTINGRHRRKDGSDFPVEVRLVIVRQQGQNIILKNARDISDRLQAEEKIRLYSEALEQSSEGLLITDAEGRIEHVNPAFLSMTGYSLDECLGNNPRMLKSGNQDDSFYQRMWDTLLAGETWQGKVVNKRKNGEFFPALLTISPLKDQDGKVIKLVALEQNMERFEELEAQFHQAQKMEAIGALVGGIAHDFNNTLAAITGNLYLAKKHAASIPEVAHRLDKLEGLAMGAAETIKQLLAFSRKGVVEMQPLTIAPFLKETIKLHRVSLPENINLQLNIEDEDMQVTGDINQLQQVLLNLINNAFDAVRERHAPEIAVQLSRLRPEASFVESHEGAGDREYACISVRDNGAGIAPPHLEHIFEPFYTTKEQGEGTGLGLAMVYGSIHTHGGFIDVDSEPGQGTTMRIFLPLTEPSNATAESVAVDDVIAGNGETILLVDDNEVLRTTTRELLEGMGYRVLTVADGMQAVEQYHQHMNEIDLLLLDVIMPHMSGPEAYASIRKLNPSVKVLFATGYDNRSRSAARDGSLPGPVISKPYTASDLSHAMYQALHG